MDSKIFTSTLQFSNSKNWIVWCLSSVERQLESQECSHWKNQCAVRTNTNLICAPASLELGLSVFTVAATDRCVVEFYYYYLFINLVEKLRVCFDWCKLSNWSDVRNIKFQLDYWILYYSKLWARVNVHLLQLSWGMINF